MQDLRTIAEDYIDRVGRTPLHPVSGSCSTEAGRFGEMLTLLARARSPRSAICRCPMSCRPSRLSPPCSLICPPRTSPELKCLESCRLSLEHVCGRRREVTGGRPGRPRLNLPLVLRWPSGERHCARGKRRRASFFNRSAVMTRKGANGLEASLAVLIDKSKVDGGRVT